MNYQQLNATENFAAGRTGGEEQDAEAHFEQL